MSRKCPAGYVGDTAQRRCVGCPAAIGFCFGAGMCSNLPATTRHTYALAHQFIADAFEGRL